MAYDFKRKPAVHIEPGAVEKPDMILRFEHAYMEYWPLQRSVSSEKVGEKFI